MWIMVLNLKSLVLFIFGVWMLVKNLMNEGWYKEWWIFEVVNFVFYWLFYGRFNNKWMRDDDWFGKFI